MNREQITAWYQASRPPFFVATLIPLILGGVIAHLHAEWHATRWIVVLIAGFLVHLCTNLANDYFDHLAGADAGDSIGGSRVVQEGKITLAQLRWALIILYSPAFVCAAWILVVSRVWGLAGFMVFAFLSSLFYTAPPVRYGYRGLGELFVGMNMGPIMVVGTAGVLTEEFLLDALWRSIPVGIMVATILYYQSLPDMDTDRAVGKRTIAVRLGRRGAMWAMRVFITAGLVSMILMVVGGLVHPLTLVCLGAAVWGYQIDRMIRFTNHWPDLHDQGGVVRRFYLVNGVILIAGTWANGTPGM